MAATPQFADLVTIPTQTQVLNQEVLPQLAANNINVTSWVLGGVYRSIAMAVAFCRADARKMLAALTAAGFEDYVFGRIAAPGGLDVTGWANFVAKQRYGITAKPATYTQRAFTLTNASGSPYTAVQPGAMIVVFPSGNRYVLNQVVTIPAAVAGVPSVITATFRSENLNAGATYNTDPSGATIALVTTQYPGVTVTNLAPTYSPVAQVGSGLGTVTPSSAPTGNHSVTVMITATGTAAASSVGWSTSLDGAAFVVQAGASAANLGGVGINITLADAGGNFVIGTQYYFATPGSDISQTGAAAETPQALGVRCAGLWPLLAFATDAFGNFVPPPSPTQAAYVALALSSNAQVVVAFAVTDGTINNLVRMYVAGQGGALLSSAVLASTQAFFNTFSMITDTILVASPVARPITLSLASGSITAKASQLAIAQQALQASLAAYLGGTDATQLLGINGTIDYAYIVKLIRGTAGVTHFAAGGALLINGVAADYVLPGTVGQYEVAAWAQTVIGASSCFAWTTS